MDTWAATQDIAAFKGRKVISIFGDGGFGQYPMDLTTAVKYGMDITHILLHNGELGKISKVQRSGKWPVWVTDRHNRPFAAFTKICGRHEQTVTTMEGIAEAIQKALSVKGPALVEIMSDVEFD